MYITMDIGGSKIAAALIDEQGAIQGEIYRPIAQNISSDELLELLYSAAAELNDKTYYVEKIGIGCPGDVAAGVCRRSPNLPALAGLPLAKHLSSKLWLPVYLENDANCAALGEQHFGSLRGADSALLLTLGSGIGAGIIINGQLLHGASGTAGEVGHLTTHFDGEPCSCGKRGCFERYASVSAFVRLLRQEAAADKEGLLYLSCDGDLEALNGKMGLAAVAMGDRAACRALDSFIDELACGIAMLVNVLDPDLIAIGGGISESFAVFGDRLQQKVGERVFAARDWQGRIIAASLGNKAGLLGASLLGD